MPQPPHSVIAHIQGGLGNQLFCYAAGRALAARSGLSLRINTRTGYRNEKYGRDCLLRNFEIEAPEAGPWEGFRGPLGRSRRSWVRKLNRNKPIHKRALIHEPRDQRYMPELLELKPTRRVYLVGYWQDERYFADAAGTLRQELTIRPGQPLKPDPWIQEQTGLPDAVSVHCRSYGEVANPEPGLILGAGYYKRAMESVLGVVPGARFIVFSDDQDWARGLIGETGHAERAVFAPPIDSDPTTATLTDFWLMRRCRHHVVANSSFSWWTAWLGEREGSVVTAPRSGLPAGARFPSRWRLEASSSRR